MRKIDQCIILFAREPILGTVKSRLSNALTTTETLKLYEKLLTHAINIAARYRGAQTHLFGTPSVDHPLFKSFEKSHRLQLNTQTAGDLGTRMVNAAEAMLENYQRVLIMGSDCPFISKRYLDLAFSKLDDNQVLFGPADDGGFVLVATQTSGLLEKVFKRVAWGESSVLESVLENTRKEKISYSLLPTLQDIDRPEDLSLLEKITWFE